MKAKIFEPHLPTFWQSQKLYSSVANVLAAEGRGI